MFRMGKRLFENVISGPVTRLKPREPFEGERGHIEIDISKCVFCMRCARECPCGCLKVNRVDGTWDIDQFKCIACGTCASVCARHAVHMCCSYRKPAEHKKVNMYKGNPPGKRKKAAGSAGEKA
jgi:ech hydrogenase subunit F